MKKILLSAALAVLATAEMNAQAPVSVGTAKVSPDIQAADPAKPTAKPDVHQGTPAPAAKETPVPVGTAKETQVIQATDPSKPVAKTGPTPSVHPTAPVPAAAQAPASIKTEKSGTAPQGKAIQEKKDPKQESPGSEKENQ